MTAVLHRIWPRSLKGQVLLAIALALMLAQGVSAALLYRAQYEKRESALLHTAAFRLIAAVRMDRMGPGEDGPGPPREDDDNRRRPPHGMPFRIERSDQPPISAEEPRIAHDEAELREILGEQDVAIEQLTVVRRPVERDHSAMRRLAHRLMADAGPVPDEVLVAGLRIKDSPQWLVARVFVPPGEKAVIRTLLGQTLFIYAVLFGAMALILRRITRPLAALTERLERFAATRDADGQLEPEGPDDIRRLIAAHNVMEGRIAALLDEKDVMLGAIGHDLKTPLAALRVRIESVEDAVERGRMARTIEDITRSLDDILSLARVGRPTDVREPNELSALVASVVEEYEDMGEPVEIAASQRLVVSLRPTWLRRALRNLVSNALRYGGGARVSLTRDKDTAVIRIEDDGPGIEESQIARMMEPFTRGEPSRNSETGGAGLGLTLARAIAEQHGGALTLANRLRADGTIAGLTATLTLPIEPPAG